MMTDKLLNNAHSLIAHELMQWNCLHEWGNEDGQAFVIVTGHMGSKKFDYHPLDVAVFSPGLQAMILISLRRTLREVGAVVLCNDLEEGLP